MSFFTFPLCPFTAFPGPFHCDRLQTIVSSKIGLDRVCQQVSAWDKEGHCQGYNRSDEHNILIRGAIICNVCPGSVSSNLIRCREARQFIDAQEGRYGCDPLVFIGGDLLWGCHNEDSPDFRLFSLLCGVNSVIGHHTNPVLVRRSMLIARQLGYKTPAVMEAALRQDQKPLSTQQLRDSLDKLEERGLIVRCQGSRRNVYFGRRLSPEALRDAVKAIISKKKKVQERRDLDRQAMEPERNHRRTT
jgi:DNA-binding HxlR family transcriptional regulator